MITIAVAFMVSRRKDMRISTTFLFVCMFIDTFNVWLLAKAIGGW